VSSARGQRARGRLLGPLGTPLSVKYVLKSTRMLARDYSRLTLCFHLEDLQIRQDVYLRVLEVLELRRSRPPHGHEEDRRRDDHDHCGHAINAIFVFFTVFSLTPILPR